MLPGRISVADATARRVAIVLIVVAPLLITVGCNDSQEIKEPSRDNFKTEVAKPRSAGITNPTRDDSRSLAACQFSADAWLR